MIKLKGAPTPKQQEFFEKLSSLFKEYEARLDGCGCCGSPAIGVDGVEFVNVSVAPDGDVNAT